MERRIAAILAADMVGYSRLIELDETGTVERQKRHRLELIDPLFEEFNGTVIKLTGDGLIAEFGSVVEAVQCSVKIQKEMAAREVREPEERKIKYRVAINLGDVFFDEGDIYGDGVNIAARLEGFAEPGGIVISGPVYDLLKSQVEVGYKPLGEKQLKNIATPVRVYQIVEQPNALPQTQGSNAKRYLIGAAGFAAVACVALLVWTLTRPDFAPADPKKFAFELPDKPSVAVLPFENSSDDKSQEMFADGMTEDLITDLSKIAGLFVIAPHTSFTYKGGSFDIREVAEQLGVRYVLDGSIRRSGDTLRVNAHLVDTLSGNSVWADRYDGELEDAFTVQDHFVLQIVEALTLQLSTAERSEIEKTDTTEVSAREAYQMGWELYSRFNEEDGIAAIQHFEKAIELDPNYGRAYGALALAHQRNGMFRWNHDPTRPRNEVYVRHVRPNLDRAAHDNISLAHLVQAMRHLNFRGQVTGETGRSRSERAQMEAQKALALQPNDAEANIIMAWALVAGGKSQKALEYVEAAKRLNPDHPYYYYLYEAAAYYGLGDVPLAADKLNSALEAHPVSTELLPFAASFNAQIGDRRRAYAHVEKWVPGQFQNLRAEAAANYFPPIQWDNNFDDLNERLLDGLQMAALPPEVSVSSLKQDLKHQDPSEQVSSIRKLGWFGPFAASALPELIEALSSPQKRVQREAAITLGKIGAEAEAAIPALEALLDLPIVGFHAQNALLKIWAG